MHKLQYQSTLLCVVRFGFFYPSIDVNVFFEMNMVRMRIQPLFARASVCILHARLAVTVRTCSFNLAQAQGNTIIVKK